MEQKNSLEDNEALDSTGPKTESDLMHECIPLMFLTQKSLITLLSCYEWDEVPEEYLDRKFSAALEVTSDEGITVSDKSEKNDSLDSQEKMAKKLAMHQKVVKRKVMYIKETVKKVVGEKKFYRLKPIFVYYLSLDCKTSGVYVVFHIYSETANFYVDEVRKYSNWKDFLENNSLPKLYLFYPENGTYCRSLVNNKEIKLVMSESAACSTSKVTRKILKTISVTTSTVSSACILTGFFVPVLMPVTVAAIGLNFVSSAHLAGESVATIVDMVQHDEAMRISNPRLRNACVEMVSSATSLASGGAGAVAKALSVESKVLTCLLRAAGIAGTAINGVASVHSYLDMLMRSVNGKRFINLCNIYLNFFIEELSPVMIASVICFLYNSSQVLTYASCQTFKVCRTVVEFFSSFFSKLLTPILPALNGIENVCKFFSRLSVNSQGNFANFIDTTVFDDLKLSFAAQIKDLCIFFNLPDLHDVIFDGVPFFIINSITALRFVQNLITQHAECSRTVFPHYLNFFDFIRILWNFCKLNKCSSSKQLIEATNFLLEVITEKVRRDPQVYPFLEFVSRLDLNRLSQKFIENYSYVPDFMNDVPLYFTPNITTYMFYVPETLSVSKPRLCKSLKKFYRMKTKHLIQKDVTKQNSKFRLSPGTTAVYLLLSPSLLWRAAIFNSASIDEDKAIIFASLIR